MVFYSHIQLDSSFIKNMFEQINDQHDLNHLVEEEGLDIEMCVWIGDWE